MGNMGYCCIENTYYDLQLAYEKMQNKSDDELSESELRHKQYLIDLCKDIATEFKDYN